MPLMALPVEDVPPLLLSEIMRHCDLFVGVASIANDPNWVDAGTDVARSRWRHHADAYWQTQSFGEIGAAGETRRSLLMALLPSLAIGKVVDFVLLHYAGWAYPAFNVADSAITVGAVLLIVDSLRRRNDDSAHVAKGIR